MKEEDEEEPAKKSEEEPNVSTEKTQESKPLEREEEPTKNEEVAKEKAETVAPDTEKEDDEKEPQPDEDADEDADEDEDRNGAAVDPLGQAGNRGNVRMPLPHLRFATPAPFVVHYSIARVPSASREVVTVDLQTNFNGTSYCHIMSQEGADGPIR